MEAVEGSGFMSPTDAAAAPELHWLLSQKNIDLLLSCYKIIYQ